VTPRVRSLPAWCAWAAIVLAGLVLWGWQADIVVLKSVRPGLIPMNPSTALGLFTLGLAMWILDHPAFGATTRGLGRLIALMAAASGLAKLGDYLLGWTSGLDLIRFADKVTFMGRTAAILVPNAALPFTLLGASLALHGTKDGRLLRLARWGAYLALTAAMVNLAGHALNVAALTRVTDHTPMALHTAIAIALLSIGRLTMDPTRGLIAIAMADGPGGRLFRQLAPLHLLLPLCLGWLELGGESAGLFGSAMGIAALTVALSVALIVVTAGYAMALERQDRERRQAQTDLSQALLDAQAATRAKTAFLANMSHELRTPLNSVIGFAEMLADGLTGPLNDQQQDFATTIGRNGHHLLRLINDLLDQAKIEAGKMTLAREPVAVDAMLLDIVRDLRPQAAAKRLDIAVDREGEAVLAEVDPLRMRQVLVNLIHNAIKFTPDGGRIRARARTDGRTLTVTVRDSGPGIAESDHERVFHLFEQADTGNSRVAQGTGLGLPIARSIVELHGGTLALASTPGAGATFTISLPLG
jgi:signal transduction histidine kinase